MNTREKENRRRRRGISMGEYLFLGALFLAFSVASLRLPSAILDWQDREMVGRREILDSQEVIVTAQEDMSLLEKMHLVNSGNINSMYMVNGRHYTAESALDKVAQELRKLRELGLLTDCSLDRIDMGEAEVEFILDMEDGERSMMLWNGFVRTDTWRINWRMDDETGKLLSISQYQYMEVYNRDKEIIDAADHAMGNRSYDAGPVDVAQNSGIPDSMVDYAVTKVGNTSRKQEPLEAMLAELTRKAEIWGEYLGLQMAESGVTMADAIAYQADGCDIIEKRVETFMAKDYSWTEAYYMMLEELGLLETAYESESLNIYAVYKDEEGEEAVVYFQNEKNSFLIVGARY